MLNSAFELISLAASNSLAVFCFFNLIIAVILVGSSKQNPDQCNKQKPNAFPTTVHDFKFKKISDSVSEKANNTLIEPEEENVSITMIVDEEENPDEEEEEEDEDEDDELRERVEEFIEKINRGWRAEKLTKYSLVQ